MLSFQERAGLQELWSSDDVFVKLWETSADDTGGNDCKGVVGKVEMFEVGEYSVLMEGSGVLW